MKAKTRYSPSLRRCHLREWQQSGLSKFAHAPQHDISVKTFGNWTRLPRAKTVHPAAPAKSAFIHVTSASPEPEPVAVTATLNLHAGCSVTAGPDLLATFIRELSLC